MGAGDKSGAVTGRLHSVPVPRKSAGLDSLPIGKGVEGVPDEVLLAAMLEMADAGVNGDLLAAKLLCGGHALGDAVFAVARNAVPGSNLNRQATLLFQAMVEMAARLVQPSLVRQPVLADPETLVAYCRLRSPFAPVQQVRLLFLDERNHLITDDLHQVGTVGEVQVYVREIIRRGLEVGAKGLVVSHSVPGDEPPNPAGSRLVCADLEKVGAVLGISLHEYLLIGRRSHHCLLRQPTKPEGAASANRKCPKGNVSAG